MVRPMWRRTWARSTDPSVRDDPSAAAEPLARRRFALPTIAMPRDGDQAEIDPADEDQRELLIVAEHPQYRHVLDDSFSDEQVNGVNPRLHVVMHWIIATPLCDDTHPLSGRPPNGYWSLGTTGTTSCTHWPANSATSGTPR